MRHWSSIGRQLLHCFPPGVEGFVCLFLAGVIPQGPILQFWAVSPILFCSYSQVAMLGGWWVTQGLAHPLIKVLVQEKMEDFFMGLIGTWQCSHVGCGWGLDRWLSWLTPDGTLRTQHRHSPRYNGGRRTCLCVRVRLCVCAWEAPALLQSDLSRPKGSLVLHRWLGMNRH